MNKSLIISLTFIIVLLANLSAIESTSESTKTSEPAAADSEFQPESRETFVNFSFDKVDIQFLVKLVGELTGRRFVIDKKVDGKITVVTPPKIPVSEVYPLFLSVLEASGCSVVERDGIYHIIARGHRATPVVPVLEPGKKLPEQGLVTKVIRIVNFNGGYFMKLM